MDITNWDEQTPITPSQLNRMEDNTVTAYGRMGMKNVLINGAFDIRQRGTNFNSYQGYSADRWFVHTGGGTSDTFFNDSWFFDGFKGSIVRKARDDGQNLHTQQSIESKNSRLLKHGVFTISFKCLRENSGNVQIEIVKANNVDNFSTVTLLYRKDISVLGGEKTDITESLELQEEDLENGIRIRISAFNCSDGEEFLFTGVQFEQGGYKTTYEYRDYGLELLLCQRYFELVNQRTPFLQRMGVTGASFAVYSFKVKKRIAPTITNIIGTGSEMNVWTQNGTTEGITIQNLSTNSQYCDGFYADAEL